MIAHTSQFTPYDDVNAILEELLNSVRAILGDNYVGMYLYGSLAIGDFNPDSSDIDFMVVTNERLPQEKTLDLEAMHELIASSQSKWANELEGSYIPLVALRRYDPANAIHPHIDRGETGLKIEYHDSDWVVQRYVLREFGLVLAGPNLKMLIDPISTAELHQAIIDLLGVWWGPMVDDPKLLHNPAYRCYGILTMCRVLYTIECGSVVSKPKAGKWALVTLDKRWRDLIQSALDWPEKVPGDNLADTLLFIRYTVEYSKSKVKDLEIREIRRGLA